VLATALLKRRGRSEAERPFWISYADLMTAMMTLWLVVMAITIIAISRKLDLELSGEEARAKDVLAVCNRIGASIGQGSGIGVDCKNNRIDLGPAGRFDYQDYHLRPEAQGSLARIVPAVLEAADSPLGSKWLKQVVIEGYTDTKGSYLYNLNLSLQRSYWVMCTLVDPRMNARLGLSPEQVRQVRELFLAGGVSFNDARESDAASRRVELRLQFFSRKEREDPDSVALPHIQAAEGDKCQLT
jgi:outer membrane protein OmpA-like peptidoglycan-associated protein